jgi:A/G-specific adenine glycosylase
MEVLSSELFAETLKAWYQRQKRDLPWRTDVSLYKTVVSEFMLQQTQVSVAIPYFERWMERFPDFQALAVASEDAVLKCWEGLGYYSRAKNLQALAKAVPLANEDSLRQVNFWLQFAGIGDYTARAIVSIAFNIPEAVVDGNVIRVLARLTRETQVFKNGAACVNFFRPLAEKCLCHSDPGTYNQAVMELGAVICKKWNPVCQQCPVCELCVVRVHGNADAYPKIQTKEKTHVIEIERFFIVKDAKILLQKIPQDSQRLRGLFELPKGSDCAQILHKGPLLFSGIRTIAQQTFKETIYAAKDATKTNIQHCLRSGCVWIPLDQLKNTPLSGPHARWIRMLLGTDPTIL